MKTDDELRAENAALRETLRRGAEARLRDIPGVIHVSVGLKETGGRVTDQLCVRVYVRAKRDRAELPSGDVIPREIDGVPTDVNDMIGTFAFQTDNTRYRPIHGGSLITNRIIAQKEESTEYGISRGTLGCLAIDNTDGAPVLLSNWHVLYAHFGEDGDKIYQPAPSSLPPISLLDLPMRPPDDTDKIAVNRRKAITKKVDAAIAAIDVSSCCNCCGIDTTNELVGLSVEDEPIFSTIVDKEIAISGMTVFKVGQSTLRTRGLIVDDDYPSFKITKGGTEYEFINQIAIKQHDETKPFSAVGDSGSVIVNLSNKIVGLLFGAGSKDPNDGTPVKYVSIANHIDDVLNALNIRIPFSEKVIVSAGRTMSDVVVQEAPVPQPYRALRERMMRHENTAHLFALGKRHASEIAHLVNHCRPCKVAWHRSQGPALLATVMGAIRDGHLRLPQTVKGVAPHEALERMRAALSDHGGPLLQEHVRRPEIALLIEEVKNSAGIDEAIERLAANEPLGAMLRGIDG